jgi:hypothetical protein
MRPQHAERLDSEIVYDRDFDYDYFGFKVRKHEATVRALVAACSGEGLEAARWLLLSAAWQWRPAMRLCDPCICNSPPSALCSAMS